MSKFNDKMHSQLLTSIQQDSVLLARQPIYNPDHSIFGFELLYRGQHFDINKPEDGFGSTGELLSNLLTCVAEENIHGGQRMFINIDQRFIESPSFFPSHSDKFVLEILETVHPTPEILDKIRQLKRQGFEFALDDYIFETHLDPFLPLISIIKIDVQDCSMAVLEQKLPMLRDLGLTLLAEKVEDIEMYEKCLQLGFDLFQGYYLCRPKLIRGVKISASKQVTLKLLAELTRPDISVKEVSELIICDPRLAIKLMLLVNSSIFSFVRKIKDVKEAVVLLGLEEVKRWAMILLLVAESQSPVEIFRLLLARAKALELFAAKQHLDNQNDYFMLGLLSGLDAVLGVEMAIMTEKISLSTELQAALNEQNGTMAELLMTLMMIENFSDSLEQINTTDFAELNEAYWQGLRWADDLMENITQG